MSDQDALLRTARKHLFILSSSGKPVFSRLGDESDLVTTFGLLQAIVSIVENAGDSIQCVRAGQRRIVYFIRKSLYFVIVTSTDEPESSLRALLEFMHQQILLILTGKIHDILRNNSSKDIRDLLGPETERLLKAACVDELTPSNIAFHAVRSTSLPHAVRLSLSSALATCVQESNSALGLVLLGDSLLAYKFNPSMSLSLDTADVLLLSHFVSNSNSFKSHDQNWVPVCMPNFNANAFLQAYISCMKFSNPSSPSSPPIDLMIVLLAAESDPNTFKDLHLGRLSLQEKLKDEGTGAEIHAEASQHVAKVTAIQSSRVCLHYLFKYRPPRGMEGTEEGAAGLPSQFIEGQFDQSLQNKLAQERIWTSYQRLSACCRVGSSLSTAVPAPTSRDAPEPLIAHLPPASDHSLNYIVLNTGHVIVCLASADSELYVTFPSTMSPLDACGQCNNLSRYLRSNISINFITE